MRKLFILAMLVLGTGLAQAQTETTTMTTEMDMPMADMPSEKMDMLANQVADAFAMYVAHIEMNADSCMASCTEKDSMISDLKMYKKHSEMVLSKKQMKKIMEMIMMEMDMKMDMDK